MSHPACNIDLFVDSDSVTDGGRSRLMHATYFGTGRSDNAFNLTGPPPSHEGQPEGQALEFTIYDIGRAKVEWPDATDVALTVGFTAADHETCGKNRKSPFDKQTLEFSCEYVGSGRSKAFGDDLGGNEDYPKIRATRKGSNGDMHTCFSGRFWYTVSFVFSVGNQKFRFDIDPEMIVREG